MSKHINIDEILEVLCPDNDVDNHPARLRKYARLHIKNLISDEIIGEDEERKVEYIQPHNDKIYFWNKLRAYQRQKLNQLFKGDKE